MIGPSHICWCYFNLCECKFNKEKHPSDQGLYIKEIIRNKMEREFFPIQY